MAILEFIAAMTKALAWPLVVLLAIILFRGVIGSRLASILKISHGKTAVEFDHVAKQVEAVIASERLPQPTLRLPDDPTDHATNVGRIIAVWGQLEDTVRRRLSSAGTDAGRMGSVPMLRLANEQNLITSEQLRALLGLNAMRNLAAHGRAQEIDEQRVQEFLVLAEAMNAVLAISAPGE
ncbi:hypothetical protein [Tistlia consotensis]|uniref:hypothetical protein n=1 Tax=Tistlia consotensis TaxID=1321365 RepID=UPI000A14D658|nr:hypothetical protein [Tistlia consotensis]